jgi:hypothetical protein
MIINQRKLRLFAIVDVRKIQYEKLHPNKEKKRIIILQKKIYSTWEAITSIRFKTAIRAVTSFGAIVFIVEAAGEPVNDV